MTELEMRCAQALDALTQRLDVTTKLYRDLSRTLAALNEQHESMMQRLNALESTLSRLESASRQLRELS